MNGDCAVCGRTMRVEGEDAYPVMEAGIHEGCCAPDNLAAAWAEAEAALPEGMHVAHLSRAEDSASDPDPDRPGHLRSRFFYETDGPEVWEAMAANVPSSTEWVDQWAEFGYGPTPAAALRALAARLREG